MGKLPNGIHGHIQGKAGGLVFYTANGQNIARSLPKSTKKKRKPTALQALQRERFKVVQDWLRPLLRIVKVGFGKYALPRTGHNSAMSYNLNHAVIYNYEESRYEVNPETFAFSSGPVPPPLDPLVQQDGDIVRFSWRTPPTREIRYTTRTILLLYAPGSGTSPYKTYGNHAASEQDTLEVSGYYRPGETCHAYVAFIDEENGDVSDSRYAGTLVWS
jgi:hypothetical protein